MKVLECALIANADFGYSDEVVIYRARVKVSDVGGQAKEMIAAISDTSWLNSLEVVPKRTFEARAKGTIDKLVNGILAKVQDKVTEEFGEYLVSNSALQAVTRSLGHRPLPLAELLKEKITGNPGFDFHTESHTGYIAFGEAKYSGTNNPYTNAITQILKFIGDKKDEMEFAIIENFVTEEAMQKALDGEKAYIAAFSINATSPENVMDNAISSEHTRNLARHKEIYLVGVEIE